MTVLFPDRVVQMVFGFDIRHDFRRQCAFPGKWTAGREAHHEE
jgi:hypothetical protein